MGKKIAIGCLSLFLIVVVGGGFAGYFFLWKPMMGGFSSLQNIHQLNTQIDNQQSYSAPADGELNERPGGTFCCRAGADSGRARRAFDGVAK
jgi:hypothetical protein